jgi:hypothetical protein
MQIKFFTSLLVSYSSLVFCVATNTPLYVDPLKKNTYVCKDISCVTKKIINFLPSGGATPIKLENNAITGYAWGEELGWINFSPTGSGLFVNATTSEITGHAWASASGWINFHPANSGTISFGIPVGVSVQVDGSLYGWAFASGIGGGWIKFDCSQNTTCVRLAEQTPQQPVTPPNNPPSGVGYFAPQPTPPTPPTPQAPVPPETQPAQPVTEPETTPGQDVPEAKVDNEKPQDTHEQVIKTPTPEVPEPDHGAINQQTQTTQGTQQPQPNPSGGSGFFSTLFNPLLWFGASTNKSPAQQIETNSSQQDTPNIAKKRTRIDPFGVEVLKKPTKVFGSIAKSTYSLFDFIVALVKHMITEK